jgi:hypothetical protein
MSERRGDRAALGSRPSLQIRERRYVAFTTQELDALEQQATQAIEITEFLPIDAIDPIYEIESALSRAEHLVESIDGRSLSPRTLEMRGRVAAALGDAPAAYLELRRALDLYGAIGATGHAERLAREIAS